MIRTIDWQSFELLLISSYGIVYNYFAKIREVLGYLARIYSPYLREFALATSVILGTCA